MTDNRFGLVRRFSLLLALAAFLGVAVHTALFFGGGALAESYIENSDYLERQASRRMESLQSFVLENDVSAFDADAISAWGRSNSVALMEIYRNHYLLYSSAAPEDFYSHENEVEAVMHDWATYYTLAFADGDAQVVVYADDVSVWRFWVCVASAATGVAVALAIFLIGCRRIVKQICIMNERVQLMEAGDLDVEIPVAGTHELGQLAQSLNSMRHAFKEQMEREKAIMRAHQTMITEMSHDLRTPLTTLQIYTDILRYKKHDTEMLDHHLELIDAKARQIKQLADNIFEYSLVSRQEEIELDPPASAKYVFHDLLSDCSQQWSQHGLQIDFELEWTDAQISVYPPYIKRTMDNVSSNLMKYASKDRPVLVRTHVEQERFCITVRNEVAGDGDEPGTRIGLPNVEAMMQKMHGGCRVQNAGGEFSITLYFPIANEAPLERGSLSREGEGI